MHSSIINLVIEMFQLSLLESVTGCDINQGVVLQGLVTHEYTMIY